MKIVNTDIVLDLHQPSTKNSEQIDNSPALNNAKVASIMAGMGFCGLMIGLADINNWPLGLVGFIAVLFGIDAQVDNVALAKFAALAILVGGILCGQAIAS